MKLLILARNYPNLSGDYSQTYIHTRSLIYKKAGVELAVISFDSKEKYEIDGIKVFPSKFFRKLLIANKYDAIICHAPNLRHHLKLLLVNLKLLPKIFFIFHGHEILIKAKFYPPIFQYMRKWYYPFTKHLDRIYDYIKIKLLGYLINKYVGKNLYIIFVSEYLKKLFLENIHLSNEDLKNYTQVINNPLNEKFLTLNYLFNEDIPYDFITIRSYDKSVYAIDIIVKIAEQNPGFNFHIYGKGNYFKHNYKPNNVTLFQSFLNPNDMPEILNKYKAALMPSYHDSQGVMACEMANIGIPVVVSKIPALHEMLYSFENVFFLNNKDPEFSAKSFLKKIKIVNTNERKARFSHENTVLKELNFIKKFIV